MSLHIGEVLDLVHLDERIASGYVRVQQHPTEPLEIYNYTEKTQYEGATAWDAIWKTLRPAGDVRPINLSEDAA